MARPFKNKEYQPQRITKENVIRAGKIEEMLPGDSFDDLLTKIFDSFERCQEENKRLKKELEECGKAKEE